MDTGGGPVVGLGQLVGHREDGQGSVFLWAERLVDPAAVDQPPLPALQEDFAQQLLVVFAVQLEGLEDTTVSAGGGGALLVRALNNAELTWNDLEDFIWVLFMARVLWIRLYKTMAWMSSVL